MNKIFSFSRTNNSTLAEWYWTIDRWLLAGFLTLLVFGAFLVAAASPAVATRIGLPSFYFIEHHIAMQAVGLVIMLGISLLSPKQIRVMALGIFAVSLALMLATHFVGYEIKGAKRWIRIIGFSIQPSEFVKPAFAVIAAWLFARGAMQQNIKSWIACIILYAITLGLLIIQPDLGMSFLLTSVWLMQFFLAGLPLLFVATSIVLAVLGIIGSYYTLDHVKVRMDKFLYGDKEENYQIEQSMAAFRHGGLLGTGPGQGKVKFHLPDAHADTIFAVAGEELGALWTSTIVFLFLAIVVRGFVRILNVKDLFTVIAVGGLLTQFGLQAFIHMASSLHLMPTKGMTLPFLSYGGSSLWGLALGMGIVLALTRRAIERDWKWQDGE